MDCGPHVGPFPSRPIMGSIRGEGTPPTNPSHHLKKERSDLPLKWLLKEGWGRSPTAVAAAAATIAATPCPGHGSSALSSQRRRLQATTAVAATLGRRRRRRRLRTIVLPSSPPPSTFTLLPAAPPLHNSTISPVSPPSDPSRTSSLSGHPLPFSNSPQSSSPATPPTPPTILHDFPSQISPHTPSASSPAHHRVSTFHLQSKFITTPCRTLAIAFLPTSKPTTPRLFSNPFPTIPNISAHVPVPKNRPDAEFRSSVSRCSIEIPPIHPPLTSIATLPTAGSRSVLKSLSALEFPSSAPNPMLEPLPSPRPSSLPSPLGCHPSFIGIRSFPLQIQVRSATFARSSLFLPITKIISPPTPRLRPPPFPSTRLSPVTQKSANYVQTPLYPIHLVLMESFECPHPLPVSPSTGLTGKFPPRPANHISTLGPSCLVTSVFPPRPLPLWKVPQHPHNLLSIHLLSSLLCSIRPPYLLTTLRNRDLCGEEFASSGSAASCPTLSPLSSVPRGLVDTSSGREVNAHSRRSAHRFPLLDPRYPCASSAHAHLGPHDTSCSASTTPYGPPRPWSTKDHVLVGNPSPRTGHVRARRDRVPCSRQHPTRIKPEPIVPVRACTSLRPTSHAPQAEPSCPAPCRPVVLECPHHFRDSLSALLDITRFSLIFVDCSCRVRATLQYGTTDWAPRPHFKV